MGEAREHIAIRPPTPGSSSERAETPGSSDEVLSPLSPDIQPAENRPPSRRSTISDTPTACEAGMPSPPLSPQRWDTDMPMTAEPSPELPETVLEEDKGALATDPNASRPVEYLAPVGVGYVLRNRYKLRHYLSDDPDFLSKQITQIPAKNRVPSRPERVGDRWEPCIHPEGQLYFRYKSTRATYFTNAYLFDEAIFRDLNQAADLVDREIRAHEDLPREIEVGLETFIDHEGDKLACYYICDMEQEEVFWLTDCDIDNLVEDGQLPVLDWDHLKHAHTQWFWHHIQMFPNDRKCSEEKLKELRRIISYHLYDRETSRTSNAPYNADDLHRFGQILGDITIEDGCVSAYDLVTIARMKTILALEQLRHYHGTKWARLDSNKSVIRDMTLVVHTRSWWFTCASWLLFYTPSIYIKRLQEMWLDQKINHQPWRKFIAEIQEDWTASITPSTVILAANVGFLAIQSVDQGGQAAPDRTTGQILSYVSTLLSIGNIIACHILARQHRASSHLYSEDALNYLINRAKEHWQGELLAIVLSIPAAFFIWGLLAFSAAMLWLCLCHTSWVTKAVVSGIVFLSAFFIILVLRNGEWTMPAVVQSFPTQMKKLRKIPVRKLTAQSRKLSVPLRKWTGKLHRNRRPSAQEVVPLNAANEPQVQGTPSSPMSPS
ncbi:hypothetical protein OH77DRAFT_1453865 [Trametes cingulata]|nr:hypothetical protein OH77DRAFT_1453865 [Trametes cingulata]